jgi:hypothetical protein
MPPDIRWQQRFANSCHALDQLETFFQPPALNERERQGLIKAFEDCFELGWNTLRDLLLAEGKAGLIGDGEAWLAMVQDRRAGEPAGGGSYLPCFRELRLVLSERVQATAAEEGDG